MKVEAGTDLARQLAAGTEGTSSAAGAELGGPSLGGPAGAGTDFAAVLEHTVEGANRLQKAAQASAAAFARGATDDLHGTMITAKEADISLKLVGTVRNRLLDAFHELWRINL